MQNKPNHDFTCDRVMRVGTTAHEGVHYLAMGVNPDPQHHAPEYWSAMSPKFARGLAKALLKQADLVDQINSEKEQPCATT